MRMISEGSTIDKDFWPLYEKWQVSMFRVDDFIWC